MQENSKKYELNTLDWRKILIGFGVAITGAALTYLTEFMANVDLGVWTPVVVSGWSVLANVVRKFLTDYST